MSTKVGGGLKRAEEASIFGNITARLSSGNNENHSSRNLSSSSSGKKNSSSGTSATATGGGSSSSSSSNSNYNPPSRNNNMDLDRISDMGRISISSNCGDQGQGLLPLSSMKKESPKQVPIIPPKSKAIPPPSHSLPSKAIPPLPSALYDDIEPSATTNCEDSTGGGNCSPSYSYSAGVGNAGNGIGIGQQEKMIDQNAIGTTGSSTTGLLSSNNLG